MNKIDSPEINASKLAAEVRKATKRLNKYRHSTFSDESLKKINQQIDENDSTATLALSTDEPSPGILARLELQPVFEPSASDEYHLNDLLKFKDVQFVKAAYRAVLKREPDSTGYNYYLQQLRAGHLDQVDILASLRFSPEGERNAVKVNGLARSRFIRRLRYLPLVGYVFGLGIDFVRLPVLLHRIRAQEAASWARSSKITQHLRDVNDAVVARIDEIARFQDEKTDAMFRQHQQQLDEQLSAIRLFFDRQLSEASLKGQQELERSISEQRTLVESLSHDLQTKIRDLESLAAIARTQTENLEQRIQHTRAELTLQARQSGIVATEADRHLPASLDQRQLQPLAADSHRLDALYSGLEDQFRGKRDDIKDRFKIYLPYIKALTFDEGFSIIDLGCGRGEWLELLMEHSLNALGVETNLIFLEACRERNLDVVEGDALKYLRGLRDNSVGVITGFHIIEHLPTEALISLLDEIIRVLRPDGIAIFETPNPENILVGSNYFYFDPTHLHPIPSLLMRYLMEARGMHRVEVLNLHPWSEARIGGESELTARINDLLYGPMDYAIMGSKVSE